MGQLSQLVLLASVVASCISYSIHSTKNMSVPEPPVEPSESDFSEYPTEFMNKLIASLSPEELEELQKPIILAESDLADRDGNTDITPCHKHLDIRNYHTVTATDNKQYIVVPNQSVVHYVCDELTSKDTYDNKCSPANPQKFTGYCCYQRKVKTTLKVVPVPKELLEVYNKNLFHKGTNDTYEDLARIDKEVWMNSDCTCERTPEIVYNHNYSCPRPQSKFPNHWAAPFTLV